MFKKIKILIFFIGVISLVFLFFLIVKNNNNKQINEPIKQVQINEIKIGTPKEEIDSLFGKEISSTTSADLLLNEYKSKNIYRPHKIYFENNISVLIVEEITDKSVTTDDMRLKYGVASNILYEKLEHSTFNLFVYTNKGVAYKGHESGGLVLEIWYFKPTDLDTFINKFANEYQIEPYIESNNY